MIIVFCLRLQNYTRIKFQISVLDKFSSFDSLENEASCGQISLFYFRLVFSRRITHTIVYTLYNKFHRTSQRAFYEIYDQGKYEWNTYLDVRLFLQSSWGYATSYVIFRIFLNPRWRTILDWIFCPIGLGDYDKLLS